MPATPPVYRDLIALAWMHEAHPDLPVPTWCVGHWYAGEPNGQFSLDVHDDVGRAVRAWAVAMGSTVEVTAFPPGNDRVPKRKVETSFGWRHLRVVVWGVERVQPWSTPTAELLVGAVS